MEICDTVISATNRFVNKTRAELWANADRH